MGIKDKVLNGETLTESEIQDVVWGYVDGIYIVEEEITDTGRWHNHKNTVVTVQDTGRYFAISWGEGATEMQEDEFYENTFTEVFPKEISKTIYVPAK